MNHKKHSLEKLTEDLILGESEVHLWTVNTNDPGIEIDMLYENILSGDEKKRADRLRFPEERGKFIISRGVLRSILSKYLKSEPRDIIFEYNKYGKPSLPAAINPGNIKFNLSHSRNVVLYAITRNNEVGVDVEYLRDVKRAGKIIERFFSSAEMDFYRAQPDDMKTHAFFRLWTGKEAYTKARGTGFSLPLKEHYISLIPADTDRSHDEEFGVRDHERFSLYEIKTDNHYIAALAIQGRGHEIRYFRSGYQG